MKNTVQNLPFESNSLPDKCCHLVIADPPYYEVKGEFDFIWTTFEDYLADVDVWARECKRILTDNGTLFWYGPSKKIAYTQIILDKYFTLHNNLVWNKGAFMGLEYSESIRTFAPCTERLLMYSKESENLIISTQSARDYLREGILAAHGKINFKEVNTVFGSATNGGGIASAVLSEKKTVPAMITKEMYIRLQNWCGAALPRPYDDLRQQYESSIRTFNNLFNLQEILNFSNESSKTGAKYDHETVKPETLTRAIILTCSNPGDTIGIPFAGSGTECAMSLTEGREFYGFDTNQKHVQTANQRCELIKSTPKLF